MVFEKRVGNSFLNFTKKDIPQKCKITKSQQYWCLFFEIILQIKCRCVEVPIKSKLSHGSLLIDKGKPLALQTNLLYIYM